MCRIAVHERERAADMAVAQPGEPAGLLTWERIEMHAHSFHEHQLAEPSKHAFAAGALGGRLGDRQTRELAEPAVGPLTVAHHHGARQGRDQWIEWAHVAAEKAADKAESIRPICRVADAIGPLHYGWQGAHVKRRATRRLGVTAHYVRIAAWKHNDIADFEPHWIAAFWDRPAAPCGDEMK